MKTLNFKFLALILMASLMFVSCSKNDEPKEKAANKLVGYWKSSDTMLSAFRITIYLNFESDGTYTLAGKMPNKHAIQTGTYRLSGNNLTTTTDGVKDTSKIVFVSDSEIKFPLKFDDQYVDQDLRFIKASESEWNRFVNFLE